MKSCSSDTERYAILEASERFTSEQKSRLINPWDILEAEINFGDAVAGQLNRDYWSQFTFWDSASMILQSEDLCPTEEHVRVFKEWSFWKLKFEE